MKKVLTPLLIVILTMISVRQVKSFDSTYAAYLQSRIDFYKSSYNLKGISASAYVPGQGTWLGASGISSKTENITSDMILGAGSITKNFMSAMVLQLIEADSLSLIDTIGRWLPSFSNVNNSVTVIQLLNHTSGLFNMTENPSFNAAINSNLNRVWTAEEILNNFILSPYFPPGTAWKYSNTNYVIIGYIVNKIMHTNVSVQLHQRFFSPLGMNESFFESIDSVTVPYAHNWVDITGDGILDDISFLPKTSTFSAASGAGAVSSRPENLVKWIRALYGGHIINQTSMNQMLTFVPASISGANGYGLGTMRFSVLGMDCYGHTGNIMGYTSVMIYDPRDSIAISLMMNIILSGGNIGKSFLSDVISNNPTGITNSLAAIPQSFSLYQNYPNPFNPETIISFDLSAKEYVKLSVINILGEEVNVLYKGTLPSGEYSYKWDAVNFPGGIYFYKLQAGGQSVVRKMMLVK